MDRSFADTVLRALADRGVDPAVDWYVVGGSGIGAGLADDPSLGLSVEHDVPLRELGLPAPSVEGHGGRLVFGTLRTGHARVPSVSEIETTEVRVAIQTGRIHPYEGHPIAVCVAPLVAVVGARPGGVVLTCAVGALDPDLCVGQVALVRDQMNLFGPTPLVGPHFLDCSNLYDRGLRAAIQRIAHGSDEPDLPEVVYAHARGPQYETPAETAALRTLGGDVVGMSTTYEALAARFLGAKVAALAVVTNAAGADALSHDEVQATGQAVRKKVVRLLSGLLRTPP